MDHYIINNKKLIQKYEDLYKEKLCVENLKEKIIQGYFNDINGESFSRFRIFLDTCIFLFNNERIHYHKEVSNGIEREKGFKDTIAYYSKSFNKNHEFDNYINFIKGEFDELSSINIDKPFIFIDKIKKNLSLRKQLKILRNSFAHMQHGNYTSSSDGRVSIFLSYNKETKNKKYIKRQMIILEPIIHDYIKRVYSNNVNIGIVYKHSFISNYSYKEKKLKNYLIFYEITTSKDSEIEISKQDMKMIGYLQNKPEKLFDFLQNNKENYLIKEKPIILGGIENFFLKNNIDNIDEKYYVIKFFLDFQTELSNFLFHLIELNDFIIEYKLLNNKEILKERINTLKEDEISYVPFKYMFLYLKAINILNRLEDDELEKVNNINIERFEVKQFKEIIKYIIKPKRAKKVYILERFRNSLAHGNIEIKLDLKGELQFIFKDIHKEKIKIIEIKAEDLEIFLTQEKFFENIKPKFKIL
ncbi:hypothetical protein [Fusobacterium sp. oral taxon 203]|uniref:hypothetical protein n=1 Tax=Fusobacterium sp. oral taxon 203 TaxID=671211 RepID=UPI000B9255F4|nr:hypothetical protein [Fusobacterium sp. oral taxon 203]ASS39940.1 hypothetical protein AXF16_07585 [Fusobacterium sp. oral taxon 203]